MFDSVSSPKQKVKDAAIVEAEMGEQHQSEHEVFALAQNKVGLHHEFNYEWMNEGIHLLYQSTLPLYFFPL